jgi:hypothetical protein
MARSIADEEFLKIVGVVDRENKRNRKGES